MNLIPTSKIFDTVLSDNNMIKENQLFNGDDYQILFTAQKNRRLIYKYANKKIKK